MCFRMPWLGNSSEDSPTHVIQSLAEITSAQAADFCGGRWTVQDKPEIGKQLVAFLRLKDTLVQKLKDSSGEKGLFCFTRALHATRWCPFEGTSSWMIHRSLAHV